jgi:hypothetical protein
MDLWKKINRKFSGYTSVYQVYAVNEMVFLYFLMLK